MGCPTKRTDANRATILRALKHGASYKRAAEAAGISYETFRTWRESDPAFSAALQKAQAAMTAKALRAIEEAHQSGAWQAAAWWLERTFPEEYGRTVQQQQVSGEVNHTVRITYVNDWRAATFQVAESDTDANVVEAIVAPAVTAASGGVEEERDGSR